MIKRETQFISTLIFLATIFTLAACRADGNDVPTLQDGQPTVGAESATDPVEDNEAAMMAYTECLRDQGLDVADPIVDADGNIGKPELIGGGEYDKEALVAAMEACSGYLEGFTLSKERADVSEEVDQLLAIAACLREKGYDVADPTAETLGNWRAGFKEYIDWDDPAAIADFEECNGDRGSKAGGK
jgi:hypothetical protein